jgi:pentose-5-phosphate-3-epimerase
MTTVSLSVLGFEDQIAERLEAIHFILSRLTSPELHIDYMGGDEDAFIANRAKPTFSQEDMALLYNEFKQYPVDFHLMLAYPDPTIMQINDIVPVEERGNVNITVHREAYRPESMGRYSAKEYDLLTHNARNGTTNQLLRDANQISGFYVRKALSAIKDLGYQAGLALEPGTSLENVTPEMMDIVDRVLCMTVKSGKGKQSLIPEALEKAARVYQILPNIVRQVDGGVNPETLDRVLAAHVNNTVIGSHFTKYDDPTPQILQVNTQMQQS